MVQGLGLRLEGLGYRLQGVCVAGLGFRLGLRVEGLEFGVEGSGRVQASGV